MPEFTPERYDLCIIGNSEPGRQIAIGAAALGATVAMVIGQDQPGTGAEQADIGLRMQVAAGRAVLRTRRIFGAPHSRMPDLTGLRLAIGRRLSETGKLHDLRIVAARGVRVIRAPAQFIDSRTITAGERRIAARRFVIATALTPIIPAIPGLADTPYRLAADMANGTQWATRLAILGGGSEAIALAQAQARLGAQVALIHDGVLLAGHDPDAVRLVLRALREDGVAIYENAEIQAMQPLTGGVTLDLSSATGQTMLNAGEIIVAAGYRQAIGAGLGLDVAGVVTNDMGIVVDDGLRTDNRRIFVAGDGRSDTILPASGAVQAGVLLRSTVLGQRSTYDPQPIPRIVWCDPEIASIGQEEAAARATGQGIRTYRIALSDAAGMQAEGAAEGFVKIVATRAGRILGVTIAGPEASELIAPWSLAMAERLPLERLASVTLAPGSRSASLRAIGIRHLAERLRSPWVQRTSRWLRKFG